VNYIRTETPVPLSSTRTRGTKNYNIPISGTAVKYTRDVVELLFSQKIVQRYKKKQKISKNLYIEKEKNRHIESGAIRKGVERRNGRREEGGI